MTRKLCVLFAFVILAGLTGWGCSYESRETTLHEPGVYKGKKDQLSDKKHEQVLIDRFRLVQTDRD